MLTDDEKRRIEAELDKYERKETAYLEALKILQECRRWISDEGIKDLAVLLNMTPDELDAIAAFYPFIFRKPVGRHIIFICDSVSCWIMGYEGILDHIMSRLGIGLAETSADGKFTLLPVSCIGMCDHAPALMIDRELHLDVRMENIDRILESYE
ncbi:MAG: NADH-quinone oxidoreductase subunit NuoE [Syntrophales bacterium]